MNEDICIALRSLSADKVDHLRLHHAYIEFFDQDLEEIVKVRYITCNETGSQYWVREL